MTYAATYRIGNISDPQRNQTKAIAPSVKRVRRLDAATEGRKRNPKGQTAVRTSSYVADGFLRTSFLPRLKETETVQACRNNAKMERDFYSSLSQLAEHYGITPKPTQSLEYPYNIATALKDAEQQLKEKVKDWEEIKLLQDSRKTYFTSEERYNTGTTLYYIPVVPLYRWLKDPKRKKTAQLLLSVCSYLYHVADIPYYRQKSSYLYWLYEMHKDWIAEDEYEEETQIYLSELAQAEWIGDSMEQKIYNEANLRYFKDRLDCFKAKDKIDADCFEVAKEAYAIYKKYSGETLFRNAKVNGEANEEDIISIDKYISFYADDKGGLNERILEAVNIEFQEYGQMEEPIINKRFDGSDITANTLEFENRLLPMINELVYILNNY